MCDCIAKVNEKLAAQGAELATVMMIDVGGRKTFTALPVPTRKLLGRRKSAPVLMPTFCPFCGVRRSGS